MAAPWEMVVATTRDAVVATPREMVVVTPQEMDVATPLEMDVAGHTLGDGGGHATSRDSHQAGGAGSPARYLTSSRFLRGNFHARVRTGGTQATRLLHI